MSNCTIYHYLNLHFPFIQSGYDAGYLYQCSMEGAEEECQPYEAPHTVPVPPTNGADLPLHSTTFRYTISVITRKRRGGGGGSK